MPYKVFFTAAYASQDEGNRDTVMTHLMTLMSQLNSDLGPPLWTPILDPQYGPPFWTPNILKIERNKSRYEYNI
jgi:hypothetical protein